MKWQFQPEDHNRQDKTRKPNYREEFVAESQFKASPIYLESFKQHLKASKAISDHHSAFKGKLALKYYKGLFFLENNRLQFCWNFKDYIKNNAINDHFSRVWRQHQKAADHDFEAILDAIRNARAFRIGADKLRVVFSVRLNQRITVKPSPLNAVITLLPGEQKWIMYRPPTGAWPNNAHQRGC